MDSTVKRFDTPDERREFTPGVFEVLDAGGVTVGRARREPGWKWSVDVGAASGDALCQIEHVGLVLEGRCAVAFENGTELILEPGDFFHVAPGHDSWVVGDAPYVSLHFMGAETYAGRRAK